MSEDGAWERIDPASLLPFSVELEPSDESVERLPAAFRGRLGEGIFDSHESYAEGSQ